MKFAYVSKGDAEFAAGLHALVASLRSCDKYSPIIVYDCGLLADQACSLQRAGCRIIPMPFHHTSRPATIQGTHYNDAIYALMHIAELDIDSFIHLDADTVVFPTFCVMADLLTHLEFVGVPDHPALTLAENIGDADQQCLVQELFPLRRDLQSQATNAGVFGAKMKTFRQFVPVMQRAYESDLELPRRDQTLLNIALAVVDPVSKSLGVRFNFRHHFRRDPTLSLSETRIENGLRQPYYADEPIAVMHYIGPDKPWKANFNRQTEAYRVWEQFSEGRISSGTATALRSPHLQFRGPQS